jgi:hypothetical protein
MLRRVAHVRTDVLEDRSAYLWCSVRGEVFTM